jgi:cob(I)alamin adenosyltransferase
VDELNAVLGRAIAVVSGTPTRERLAMIQQDLFALGAHLAAPPSTGSRRRPDLPPLPEGRILEMETWIDEAEEGLAPLRSFILPGGSTGASELHVCRTVCRRAERACVPLLREEDVDAVVAVRYLNRLSDLLFVLARQENAEAGVREVEWRKESEGGGA